MSEPEIGVRKIPGQAPMVRFLIREVAWKDQVFETASALASFEVKANFP